MPEISQEELDALKKTAEEKAALEASKKRAEEEMSKYKTRAQTAEEKLSQSEKEKLEKEGNLQELLEKERKEKQALLDKNKTTQSIVLREKLRSEVAKIAKDAHDIDMVLRVKEHKDLLKLDEENLTVAGVEEFVAKVRETHPFLYGTKRMPDDADRKPGMPKDDNSAPDNRSDEEKFREELKQVTSRAEQVKVYKKYGKPIDNYMLR